MRTEGVGGNTTRHLGKMHVAEERQFGWEASSGREKPTNQQSWKRPGGGCSQQARCYESEIPLATDAGQ